MEMEAIFSLYLFILTYIQLNRRVLVESVGNGEEVEAVDCKWRRGRRRWRRRCSGGHGCASAGADKRWKCSGHLSLNEGLILVNDDTFRLPCRVKLSLPFQLVGRLAGVSHLLSIAIPMQFADPSSLHRSFIDRKSMVKLESLQISKNPWQSSKHWPISSKLSSKYKNCFDFQWNYSDGNS